VNIHRLAPLAVLCLSALLSACVPGAGGGGLPQPTCYSMPSPVSRNLGAPAPRAGKTSVLMQLDPIYVQRLVQKMVQDAAGPDAQYGIDIRSARLTEIDAPVKTNLIALTFVPWVKNSTGTSHTQIERPYTVKFRLTPYLLTRGTMPDDSVRAEALGGCPSGPCPTVGAVVALDLEGLYGGGVRPAGALVQCGADFDLLDSAIQGQVYKIAASAPPIPIPLDTALQALAQVGVKGAQLVGVDLATDDSFSLALVLDKGTPSKLGDPGGPFSASPGNSTTKDWGVLIDGDLINAAVQSQIAAGIAQHNQASSPALTLNSTSVALGFEKLHLQVGANTSVSVCDIGLNVALDAAPAVCRSQQGGGWQLGVCLSNLNASTSTNFLCQAAIDAMSALGLASFGGQAPSCVAAGKPLQFPFGKDALYATNVDVFRTAVSITGNSVMMDQINQRAVPAAGRCPWDK
jgi:hypothetical protein